MRLGTGIGWQGLPRVNGGYFKGPNVNSTTNGIPKYDFKYKPLYYSISASARRKHFDFGLEYAHANFHSDVTYFDTRRIADLKFNLWNFNTRFIPFQKPKLGFQPFVEGGLNLWFYNYTDIDTSPLLIKPLESSSASLKFAFTAFVGTDYYFSKNFGVYVKAGYGFEICQFGVVVKLFERNAD